MKYHRCCANCQHFALWPRQPAGLTSIGDCRRHAPEQFQSAKTDKIMTKWPSVKEADFCGSFRATHEAEATEIKERDSQLEGRS